MRRTKRTSLTLTVVILVGIGLFLLRSTTLLAPIQRPLVAIGTWFQERSFWRDQSKLITPSELEKLRSLQDQLAVQTAQTDALEQENKSLKEALGFLERTQQTFVPGAIISRSLSGIQNIFTIDVGKDEGVQVGDAVIVKDGILIGKVVETTNKQARVIGLTDPDFATAVTLLNESRTLGMAQGTTGDLFEIKFIPEDQSIEVNNLVVTSGLEDGIPTGLVLGLVNLVTEDPSAPFLQAVVEPLIDSRTVHTLFVLTRPGT